MGLDYLVSDEDDMIYDACKPFLKAVDVPKNELYAKYYEVTLIVADGDVQSVVISPDENVLYRLTKKLFDFVSEREFALRWGQGYRPFQTLGCPYILMVRDGIWIYRVDGKRDQQTYKMLIHHIDMIDYVQHGDYEDDCEDNDT